MSAARCVYNSVANQDKDGRLAHNVGFSLCVLPTDTAGAEFSLIYT